LDQLGFRKLIGLVVPSTNTVVQPETDALRPRGVTNHVGRIPLVERKLTDEKAYLDHVAAMRAGIETAIEQVMTCKPHHMIMGVALEAFWGGVKGAAQLQAQLEAKVGVGVSIGSTSIDAALKKFGARRIAVLTPHMPKGDDEVRTYFTEAGYEVVRLKGLKIQGATLIAQVPVEDIRKSLIELNGDDVDALIQVGTNLPGAQVAAEAEPWLGKPVIAINTVMYWDALRRTGIEDRVYGRGWLMERF
jgi:maleate isomerase